MSSKHNEYLIGYLEKHEETAFLGSDLLKVLLSQFSELNDSSGRKVISQCKKRGLIKSSEPVKFSNNQYAYSSIRSTQGYSLYKKVIKLYKPQLFRIVYALNRNNHILSLNDFYRISGVTTNPDEHTVSSEQLLEDLERLNIARKSETDGIEYLYFINNNPPSNSIKTLKEELKDKNFLLSCCTQWLEKSNIISRYSTCYLGESNQYSGINRNNMFWDSFGYTNTVGLGSSQRDNQTIVIIDFSPKHQYQEYDFKGFKDRVDHLVFSVKHEKRKVMPIVIADSFSPTAITRIRDNNYMLFSVDSVLGKKALQVSQKYRETVNTIEQRIAQKEYSSIIDDVSNLYTYLSDGVNEVNFGNLKGILFEYLMYPVLTHIFCKKGDRITHHYEKSLNNFKFEFDYFIETETEDIFIELKGYKKNSVIQLGKKDSETHIPEKNSILWFLKQYDLAKEYIGKRPNRKAKFCYITTCSIHEDGKKTLEKRNKECPDSLASYYEYDSLMQLLEKHGKKEKQIVTQFYDE